MLVSYKCYFIGFAHSQKCSPLSHLWISITLADPDRLFWSSFSERRFNEGEHANGLSSIQSKTRQLACDGYWGQFSLCVCVWQWKNVGKCGSRQHVHMFLFWRGVIFKVPSIFYSFWLVYSIWLRSQRVFDILGLGARPIIRNIQTRQRR